MTYNNLKKKNTKSKNLSNINANFKSLSKFISTKSNEDLGNEIGKHVMSAKPSLLKDFSTGSNVSANTTTNPELLYSAIIDELIEDEQLKTLINDKGEIIVGNSFYKITPFGVIYASKDKEAKVIAVYEKILSQNDIAIRLTDPTKKLNLSGVGVNNITQTSSNQQGGIKVNYEPELRQEVDMIDTFGDNSIDNNYGNNGGGYYYGGGSGGGGSSTLNTDPYGDMLEEEIDFKDGFGSFVQTIFTNSTRYNFFDENYRVSVLFYDRNYGLIKTLGLKVKLQKKGLLWWNKTEAEEIRAGWERIVYSQANSLPQLTRPVNQPIEYLENSYISPYEPPLYGWFTTQSHTPLYKWNFAKSNHELFSIVVPYYLIPFSEDGLTVKSSQFKPIAIGGWNYLKNKLTTSVPAPTPLLVHPDPDNFKFPVYDISDGSKVYLSINDMKNMPKTINSAPTIYQQIAAGQKIKSYLTPYEVTAYNSDIIDIPLDFSTATISLSQNLNTPLSITRTLNSIGVKDIDDSFEVQEADVFGTVKHNGRWLGIRIKAKL